MKCWGYFTQYKGPQLPVAEGKKRKTYMNKRENEAFMKEKSPFSITEKQ